MEAGLQTELDKALDDILQEIIQHCQEKGLDDPQVIFISTFCDFDVQRPTNMKLLTKSWDVNTPCQGKKSE